MIIRTCVCGETFLLRTEISPWFKPFFDRQITRVREWNWQVDRHLWDCKRRMVSMVGTEDMGDYL